MTLGRVDWWILATFVLVNLLIFVSTVPGANLTGAADGGSWYDPAVAFLRFGSLVELHMPDIANLYRPPLFPLFGAGMMSLFGEEGPLAIIAGQMVLLFCSGLVFRAVVESVVPGYGPLGMALFLFNPNVLSTAHLVQSETLFAFFILVSFWAICTPGGRLTWSRAAVLGTALGLACLVRPTPQFLVLVLPVGTVLLAILSGQASDWLRAAGKGFLAMAIAIVIVAPWAHFIKQYDGSYALAPNDIKYRYVYDQIVIIEAQINGLSYHQAELRLDELMPEHMEAAACKELTRHTPEYSSCYADLVSTGYAQLLSYPVLDFAKAMFRSIGQFGLAGGAGNWHNLFDLGTNEVSGNWFSADQQSLWSVLSNVLQPTSLPALLFTVISLGYVLLLRLLGLAGLVQLLRQHNWPAAAVVAGYVVYFALIVVFVGNSRYRVAVEPALVLLAVAGIAGAMRQRDPVTRRTIAGNE